MKKLMLLTVVITLLLIPRIPTDAKEITGELMFVPFEEINWNSNDGLITSNRLIYRRTFERLFMPKVNGTQKTDEKEDENKSKIDKTLILRSIKNSKVLGHMLQKHFVGSNETKSTSASKKTPYYTATEEELEILYHIVEAEATDGTIAQRQNVCSNIFVRVESDEWPNTIKGVVFQKGQYSPISDGRYYSVKITDETKEAVKYILENGITFTDADGNIDTESRFMFFCSYGCKSSYMAAKDKKLASQGKECFRDGIHRYYVR